MPERLVLVGLMGAGKSTVGRLAARALGWGFTDVDTEVERAAGRSVAEVFATSGEDAFRAAEEQALARCLEEPGDTVVSVGGGAVLSSANRQRLAGAGTVVWLRARPDTLAARVGRGGGRPLLAGGPEVAAARLAELAVARAPLYEAVADVVVDVDDRTAEAVAAQVCAAANRRAGEAAS